MSKDVFASYRSYIRRLALNVNNLKYVDLYLRTFVGKLDAMVRIFHLFVTFICLLTRSVIIFFILFVCMFLFIYIFLHLFLHLDLSLNISQKKQRARQKMTHEN